MVRTALDCRDGGRLLPTDPTARMKILVYSRNFLPDLGGLERNTLTLAASLTKLGHETVVLTETLDDDGAPHLFKTIRSRGRMTLLKAVMGSDLVFINGGVSMKV